MGGSGGWVVAVEAGQEGGRSTMNPSLSVSRRRVITPSQVVSITNKGDWWSVVVVVVSGSGGGEWRWWW